mgnify:CR=1 FL=1
MDSQNDSKTTQKKSCAQFMSNADAAKKRREAEVASKLDTSNVPVLLIFRNLKDNDGEEGTSGAKDFEGDDHTRTMNLNIQPLKTKRWANTTELSLEFRHIDCSKCFVF